MGNGETKIVYEEREQVDPGAAEEGRRRAREENTKKMRELQKKLKEERERARGQAQFSAHVASRNEEKRAELRKEQEWFKKAGTERTTKELEDQCVVLELKEDLEKYEFGSKLGKDVFSGLGLNISDIGKIRIAFIGPTGSGKSCLIGTIERSLHGQRKQTNFAHGSGGEGTIILEDYLTWHSTIRLLDTRGFFDVNEATTEECLNIMSGRLKIGEQIERDYDTGSKAQLAAATPSSPPVAKFNNMAHGVVFVIKANDARLTDGLYLDRMKMIREHLSNDGNCPVTVITFDDGIKTEQERANAFHKASAATGSPRDRTFFISNYTHDHKDDSLQTEKQALDILDTVLYSAERYVKIQKLRQYHSGPPAAPATPSSEPLREFMQTLQSEYKWSPEVVKEVTENLRKDDITTVNILKENWEEAKKLIPKVGMKVMIERKLQQLGLSDNQ